MERREGSMCSRTVWGWASLETNIQILVERFGTSCFLSSVLSIRATKLLSGFKTICHSTSDSIHTQALIEMFDLIWTFFQPSNYLILILRAIYYVLNIYSVFLLGYEICLYISARSQSIPISREISIYKILKSSGNVSFEPTLTRKELLKKLPKMAKKLKQKTSKVDH